MAPTYRKFVTKRSPGFDLLDRRYRKLVPNGILAGGDSLQFFSTPASDRRYQARVRRVAKRLFGRPSRVGFTAGNLFKDFWDPKKKRSTLKHSWTNRPNFITRAHRVVTLPSGHSAAFGSMVSNGTAIRSILGPEVAQSWANRLIMSNPNLTYATPAVPRSPAYARPPPTTVVLEPVADEPLEVRRVTSNAVVPIGTSGVTPYREPVVVGLTPAGERVFNVRPPAPNPLTDRYLFEAQRHIRRRVAL